jgi:acetyl esterase/lipase
MRYLVQEEGIKPSDMIVAGDSAGGHLIASMLTHMVEPSSYAPPLNINHQQFKAVILISPWISLDTEQQSFWRNNDKDYLNRQQGLVFLNQWNPKADEIWAEISDSQDSMKVWSRICVGDGKPSLVKRMLVTGGTAEVLFDSIQRFGKAVVKAHPIIVSGEIDNTSLEGVDFILVEAVNEVHAQAVVDEAIGYTNGRMTRSILLFLESL